VTPETVSTFSTVTAGVVMLYLATRKRMIELRGTMTRCPSCGRLHRRGDVCRCVRR
jgi:predicted metalloprotease